MTNRSARLLLAGLAGLALGAGAVGAVWTLSQDNGPSSGDGRVVVGYEPGPAESERLIKGSGLFDDVAATVSREIALPRDLEVRVVGKRTAEQAGVSGPTYKPDEEVVYLPWSFVQRSHRDLLRSKEAGDLKHPRIDEVLADAMAFVLYHELAHGLFDVLRVPVVAGEERTADSLATVLALRADRRGLAVPLSVSVLELARAERGGVPSIADYSDDHGFDSQRAFDARCAAYGAAPEGRRSEFSEEELPGFRARLCPYDYEAQLRGWRRILERHLTEEGGLLPLDE
jgi:hypothetical protein